MSAVKPRIIICSFNLILLPQVMPLNNGHLQWTFGYRVTGRVFSRGALQQQQQQRQQQRQRPQKPTHSLHRARKP